MTKNGSSPGPMTSGLGAMRPLQERVEVGFGPWKSNEKFSNPTGSRENVHENPYFYIPLDIG